MGTITKLRATRSERTPLELVSWRQEQDLREVTQTDAVLWGWVKRCRLKNGQMALFSNRMQDRFRMVCLYNGMPMLIILPVGKTRQFRRQLYTKLAAWLVDSFLMRDKVAQKLVFDLADVWSEAA